MQMAKVRFTKGWRRFRVGDQVELPEGTAQQLHDSGRLEFMVPEQPVEAEVVVEEKPRRRKWERVTA